MNPDENAPEPIAGLTEGRIVHYVLPDGRNIGEHRPAIIVKVWDPWQGTSQLQVFMDGNGSESNDGTPNVVWATSIVYSEAKEYGTWHWIEKA